MRTLYEIIEDVKGNKRPDYEELRYALLAIEFVALSDHRSLRKELLQDERSQKVFREMRAENSHDMFKCALNNAPKKFVGWNYDPENPEYQERRKTGEKIFVSLLSKFEKGEENNV